MLTTITTCLHCGTVNHAADTLCAACGANLVVDDFYSAPAYPPDYYPIADPDLIPKLQPFSLPHTLSTTLKLFAQHFWLITKIVFVIVTPLEILKATTLATVADDPQVKMLTVLLGAACNIVIAPALIYVLIKELQTGKTASVQEAFRWGLSKIPQFALCAVAAYFLQGVGYLLFIIPGIIIGLHYAVVYPVAILEDVSIREVFSRSSKLTRGSRLEILAAQILIQAMMLLVTAGLTFLLSEASFAPLTVIGSVVVDIAEQLPVVLAFVMYLGLLKSDQLSHHGLYAKN
jgi:hypothetical protein